MLTEAICNVCRSVLVNACDRPGGMMCFLDMWPSPVERAGSRSTHGTGERLTAHVVARPSHHVPGGQATHDHEAGTEGA